MNILNHRITRITVGILLLVLAAVVLLPGLTGFTSLDGTVNAHLAVINAPIDGEIAGPPQRIGTPVSEGQVLATIRNRRVNRAILASLRAEHGTALRRVAALERERNVLVRLRDQLAERLEAYQNATIASLERQLHILRKRGWPTARCFGKNDRRGAGARLSQGQAEGLCARRRPARLA